MNRIAMAAAAALAACGGTRQGTASIISSIPGVTFDKPVSAASSAAVRTCGQTSNLFSKLQAGLVSASITTLDAQGVSSSSEATGGFIAFESVDGDTISGSFTATGFVLSPGSTLKTPGLKTAEAINPGTLTGTFSATGCHVPATECSGG